MFYNEFKTSDKIINCSINGNNNYAVYYDVKLDLEELFSWIIEESLKNNKLNKKLICFGLNAFDDLVLDSKTIIKITTDIANNHTEYEEDLFSNSDIDKKDLKITLRCFDPRIKFSIKNCNSLSEAETIIKGAIDE